MKQIIDLRPVYHRLEERIRPHAILCWLALLLMRIIETTPGSTWPACHRELDRLHLGTFTGPGGCVSCVTARLSPTVPRYSLGGGYDRGWWPRWTKWCWSSTVSGSRTMCP
jgi:hypothetical protein